MIITNRPLSSAEEFWDQMFDIGFVVEADYSFGERQIAFDLIHRGLGNDFRIFGHNSFYSVWKMLEHEDD